MKRILAIDPGNAESAYCEVNVEALRPLDFAKVKNEALLEMLYGSLFDGESAVVIERVASYGMAVGREVFETCEWVGRFTEAASAIDLPVEYVYRREEKLHICGDSRAKDANIRRALIDRFAKHDLRTGRGTKREPDWFYGFAGDIWAAYAVAVTFIETRMEERQWKTTS